MKLSLDERVGCIVWLLLAVAIAVLGFWHPDIVADRNAAPDDRFGGLLLIGLPFEILGAVVAVRATFGLIVLARRERTRSSWIYLILGTLLMMFSLSPLVVIGRRLAFH